MWRSCVAVVVVVGGGGVVVLLLVLLWAGGRRGRSLAVVELLRLDGYVSTLARGSEARHGVGEEGG